MLLNQNKSLPLVSVCIPTHNSAPFLKEVLESILNQTYSNIEIIISDNDSKDETEIIAKSFAAYNRISIFKNSTNIGCYNNYNKLINLSKGVFIAIYHSDDIYESNIVDKEVEFLTNNPNAGAVFTMSKIINKNSQVVKELHLPRELTGKNIFDIREIYSALLVHENSFLICPTFMTRKNILMNVGLFNEKDFKTSADLEMWLRILEKYPIGIIKEKLMKYRMHNNQGAFSYEHMRTKEANFFLVMDYFSKKLSFYASIDNKKKRQYEYLKCLDNTKIAINLLIIGKTIDSLKLLKKDFTLNIFRAFFENIKFIKIRNMTLRIILIIGIKIGISKYLGKILKKYNQNILK